MTTSNKMLMRGFAAALALILGAPAAQAAEVWLEAKAFTSGAGVLAGTTMWGYADCGGSFAGCAAATASSPGPTITVPPGEGLTIHLRNSLTEATSVHLVAQPNAPLPAGAPRVNGRLQSLVPELPPGADGDYSWTDAELRPGTYLYQSGSHVQLQVQMGLYGAMVHDDVPGSAYPGVPYDSSRLYVLSEVDAALHSPPSPVNATAGGYQPRVLLVNGVPLDGPVLPAITAGAGERVLLRLVNAGLLNHAPQLIGGRFDIVAEDGHLAPVTRSQTSLLLPAAKTADLLFMPAAAGTYGFFDQMARIGPPPPPEGVPPSAPGTPTFSNITFNSATANWTAATDNVGVTGYDYSLDGLGWTSIGNVLTVNLSGLTPSTLYTFYVRARDFSGNIGPASSNSFTTDDPPPESEPPTAPGIPAITDVTHNGATATWTAATDNIGVTGYDYSLDGLAWTSIGNVLTVDLTGLLTPSTLYTFQVRARDFAGNIGPAESSAPFTTDPPPPDSEPPTAPGTPTFANITMTTATADWTAATDNVGVTGYEYSLDGFTWTPIGVVLSTGLSGLTHSTTYTFQVRAMDAAGNVGPDSSAQFTTAGPANPVANPDLFYVTVNDNPGTTTFATPGVLANDTDAQFDALRVAVGSVTALLG
ncbi:MAG: fibronectin type III domain-containing protein, partial [Steroidobacteraceae bacterium]